MDNSVIKIIKKNNASIIIDVNQIGHGFSVAQVLYYTKPSAGARGKYALANASQISTANAIGFVYEVVDANNFRLITNGMFQNIAFKNYMVGETIYLGLTNGSTTNIESIYNKPLGVKTRSGIYVNIQRGWINNSFESGDDHNGFIASSSSASTELSVSQTGHGLLPGDVIYCSETGYGKAIANESEMSEVIGIVSKVVDVNNFKTLIGGFYKTAAFNAYPNGTILFLSEDTPGTLTDQEGYVSKPVAIKIDNGIIIDIKRGFVEYTNGNETPVPDSAIYKIDDQIGDIKYAAGNIAVRSDGYVLFENGQVHSKAQVQPLLDSVSVDFLNTYIVVAADTITFKNVEYLTDSIYFEGITKIGSLYIKAFNANNGSLVQVPVGSTIMMLSTMPPSNYVHMDGRVLVIADYPVLASYIYSTYGSYTVYGGDGITTFGLPNLNAAIMDHVTGNPINMYYYIKYC